METNILDASSVVPFEALTDSQREGLRVRTNLKFITDFMREHAVTKIEASYSGDGDSGNGIYLYCLDARGNHLDGNYSKPAMLMNWFGRMQQDRLQGLVEQFTDDLISCAGHDGYENNDGGGGTLTILADGTFTLDHYDNVVSTVESSYDHNDLLEDV